MGRRGEEEGLTKGKRTFGCGDGFTGIYVSQKHIQLHILNMYCLLYARCRNVSYTSIKLNKAIFTTLKRHSRHPKSVCSSTCHTA